MRPLLLFYVVIALTLNFLRDEDLFFYLAMSTFPVTLYLLFSNSKKKKRKSSVPDDRGKTHFVVKDNEHLANSAS
jgi:hypothetical protein